MTRIWTSPHATKLVKIAQKADEQKNNTISRLVKAGYLERTCNKKRCDCYLTPSGEDVLNNLRKIGFK